MSLFTDKNRNKKIIAIVLFIVVLMTMCLTVMGVFQHFKAWIYANHVNDKIAHIVFGTILTVLASYILYPRKLHIFSLGIDLGPAIMFFLFSIDEASQAIIPGRDADILDWVASITGLILGTLIFNIWRNFKQGDEE